MINRLKYFISANTIPYENLALEEYLLNTVKQGECILYLWQNKNTVVIGKNQNAMRECRIEALQEGGGYLARRLSGGGAVYHDLGNLNFTFLVREEDYDVHRQLDVIVKAAAMMGIKAEETGRNDITIDGKKFSGNAFYKSGNRCYHHGTIMVCVDKEKLSQYLRPSAAKLASKGVASVKSRVTNLSEHAPAVSIEKVVDYMIRAFADVYGAEPEHMGLGEIDQAAIASLTKKYASWDWCFGRLADFCYSYERSFPWGEVQLSLNVDSGFITEAELCTDSMAHALSGYVCEALNNCRFEKHEMMRRLETAICAADAGDGDAAAGMADMIRDIQMMILNVEEGDQDGKH